MRRRAAAVVVAALLGGCGVTTEAKPRLTEDHSVPFDLLEPDAARLVPPPTAEVTEPVSLCFVKGERLVMTERRLDAPVSLSDVARNLTEPPLDAEGLRTALGGPRLVADVALRAGVVTVDLTDAVSTLGGNDQLLAVAQLVCSLTARPGVGQVAFTLGGAPVDVPLADGSLTSGPVSRDSYTPLFA